VLEKIVPTTKYRVAWHRQGQYWTGPIDTTQDNKNNKLSDMYREAGRLASAFLAEPTDANTELSWLPAIWSDVEVSLHSGSIGTYRKSARTDRGSAS
jgi:hypothetical protein